MGCPRLCSRKFSAGPGLHCCGKRRPSLVLQHPHQKLDVALNDTLHIISGCLKSTRRELLPVLSGIPPAHLRREHSTFKLALQAQLNTNRPLHTLVDSVQFLGTKRLHSRPPFHHRASALINSGFNILESRRVAWESGTYQPSFWSPLTFVSRLAQSYPVVCT